MDDPYMIMVYVVPNAFSCFRLQGLGSLHIEAVKNYF
ncbi:Glutaredoxin [Caenorhabditis elegans]|uniref:Glutaredoxin n=1 Tax=Caenorhabditis elegans TaxID=6239 RepID=F5GUI3_CAEEL|nr:Glutaredoxin [Caenorhabditis elegans]CCA65595.1 Glutaredoxin [Caenorhabditis elegans]|eukprot:NP_001256860.1 Uncharacterized protein CELE_M04C3.5 [Caenorhabditis elegans]